LNVGFYSGHPLGGPPISGLQKPTTAPEIAAPPVIPGETPMMEANPRANGHQHKNGAQGAADAAVDGLADHRAAKTVGM